MTDDLAPVFSFELMTSHPIDLHLIFEQLSLKNQVGRAWFLVYFEIQFFQATNQVWNRQKIKFVQLDLLNFIFHYQSADQ